MSSQSPWLHSVHVAPLRDHPLPWHVLVWFPTRVRTWFPRLTGCTNAPHNALLPLAWGSNQPSTAGGGLERLRDMECLGGGREKAQRDSFHQAGKAAELNPLMCDTNQVPCWTLFLNHFFIMLNRGETLPATRYP